MDRNKLITFYVHLKYTSFKCNIYNMHIWVRLPLSMVPVSVQGKVIKHQASSMWTSVHDKWQLISYI